MAKIVQLLLEESKRIDGIEWKKKIRLLRVLIEVKVDPQRPTVNWQSLVDVCVVTVNRFL